MAYLRESWMPSGLGCGPNCNCGPCRARFAGFGERFIPEDEDEEQDPEQAPPEEGAEDMPGPPMDSAGSPQSAQNVPPGRASAGPRASRGPRAGHRRRRVSRLSEYSFGHWMPLQGGWGRFAAADYPAPFGFYDGFGQAGMEQAALSAAVRRGERNPNKLTDMLFFARHPERHGARLRPEEVESTGEWRVIRDQVVRPALMAVPGVPAVQSGAPTPTTPTEPPSGLDPHEKLRHVHPELARRVSRMARALLQRGVPIRVTSGLRTFAEQDALYAQGRTTPGNIVTKARAGQSNHNYGLAVDVAPVGNGRPNWTAAPATWQVIGEEGKRAGLSWGGDWKGFVDRPHFELPVGMSVQECFRIYKHGGLDALWAEASRRLQGIAA